MTGEERYVGTPMPTRFRRCRSPRLCARSDIMLNVITDGFGARLLSHALTSTSASAWRFARGAGEGRGGRRRSRGWVDVAAQLVAAGDGERPREGAAGVPCSRGAVIDGKATATSAEIRCELRSPTAPRSDHDKQLDALAQPLGDARTGGGTGDPGREARSQIFVRARRRQLDEAHQKLPQCTAWTPLPIPQAAGMACVKNSDKVAESSKRSSDPGTQ